MADVISKIEAILTKIGSAMDKRVPTTITDALEHEALNLYVFHSLKIAKGKLTNDLRSEDIASIKQLRKYFEMAKQKRTDSDDDRDLLRRLYRKHV